MKRLAPLLLLTLALAGCTLRPLYAGGNRGKVASVLAQVEIAPIEGQSPYSK